MFLDNDDDGLFVGGACTELVRENMGGKQQVARRWLRGYVVRGRGRWLAYDSG